MRGRGTDPQRTCTGSARRARRATHQSKSNTTSCFETGMESRVKHLVQLRAPSPSPNVFRCCRRWPLVRATRRPDTAHAFAQVHHSRAWQDRLPERVPRHPDHQRLRESPGRLPAVSTRPTRPDARAQKMRSQFFFIEPALTRFALVRARDHRERAHGRDGQVPRV